MRTNRTCEGEDGQKANNPARGRKTKQGFTVIDSNGMTFTTFTFVVKGPRNV